MKTIKFFKSLVDIATNYSHVNMLSRFFFFFPIVSVVCTDKIQVFLKGTK